MSLVNLKVGSYTNRNKISELLDINLTGWSAIGINRVDDSGSKKGYRIVGDVDLESMIDKVSYITPVPGGVGPMTIAMLLYNTVLSAESRSV